jgi:hypothetical protein
MPEPTREQREQAARLFCYLNAIASLRSNMERDLASYKAVFWFNDLPREKECNTPAWDDKASASEDDWLQINKPSKPPTPKPPDNCINWFDPASLEVRTTEPKLRKEIDDPDWIPPEITNPDAEPPLPDKISLTDFPQIASDWEKYFTTQWRPWREEHQRWERVQEAYRKLFTIYQEQQRRGEQYELLVGVGTLLWIDPKGHKICRPTVTAKATIGMETTSGRITVGPAVSVHTGSSHMQTPMTKPLCAIG